MQQVHVHCCDSSVNWQLANCKINWCSDRLVLYYLTLHKLQMWNSFSSETSCWMADEASLWCAGSEQTTTQGLSYLFPFSFSLSFSVRLSFLSTPLTLSLLSSLLDSALTECVCVFLVFCVCVCTQPSPPSLCLLCALWLSSSYLCQIKRKVRPAVLFCCPGNNHNDFSNSNTPFSFLLLTARGQKIPTLASVPQKASSSRC